MLQRPTGLVLCLTTVPDAETGERLAARLVEERLIACASLVPGLTSLYRWQGELAREAELLMLMKTPARLLERLEARLGELHPYETPEFLSVPVEAGAEAYCRWVMQETTEVNA
jgi:periplasmic divalent cation tolerance protein